MLVKVAPEMPFPGDIMGKTTPPGRPPGRGPGAGGGGAPGGRRGARCSREGPEGRPSLRPLRPRPRWLAVAPGGSDAAVTGSGAREAASFRGEAAGRAGELELGGGGA